MIFSITLLTSLLFSFTYPLSFWICFKDPLKNNFHRFHIGLSTIIGVITLFFVIRMQISPMINVISIFWMIAALGITAFYWKKETVGLAAVTFLAVLGLYITWCVKLVLTGHSSSTFLISILGGLIFSSSLFAMNLGHWYLNVHGLPLKHLRNATVVFWVLIVMRFVWDLYYIFTQQVVYLGDTVTIFDFIKSIEGILLIIPVFFGTIFPLFALFMVHEIIKLKNTQAATGILYVILCGVLLGDVAYKYYFIKFGISL